MNAAIRILLITGAIASFLIAVDAACRFVLASQSASRLKVVAARSQFESMGEEMDILNALTGKLKQSNALNPESQAEAIQTARERARQTDFGKLAELDRIRHESAKVEAHWLAVEFLGAGIWLSVCLIGLRSYPLDIFRQR